MKFATMLGKKSPSDGTPEASHDLPNNDGAAADFTTGFNPPDGNGGSAEVEEGARKDQESEDPNLTRGLFRRKSSDSNTVKMTNLHQDTFSFLITSKPRSIPALTAVFFGLLKLAIFILISFNLSDNDSNNILGVPVYVPWFVFCAHLLALVVALLTQNDLTTAIILLYEGYGDGLKEAFPDSSRSQWIVAITALMVEGMFSLAITFMLVIRSEDVVDLLLNFSALEFVASIDDIAFYLAKKDFLGQENKEAADMVEDLEYPIQEGRKGAHRAKMYLLTVIFFVLFVMLSTVYSRQLQGRYLPQSIIVQFDDDHCLEPGLYSGLYQLNNTSGGPGFSVEYRSSTSTGFFRYARSNERWEYQRKTNENLRTVFQSAQIRSRDITAAATADWFIFAEGQTRPLPMDNFQLLVGCDTDEDCGGETRGTCQKNRCECSSNYYGLRCDYENSKTDLCVNRVNPVALDEYVPMGTRTKDTYSILWDVATNQTVFHRSHPVYVHLQDDSVDAAVIFYTGVRWAYTIWGNVSVADLPNALKRQDLEHHNFRSETPRFGFGFFSEPVRFNGPMDAATPSGFDWYESLLNDCSQEGSSALSRADFVLFPQNNWHCSQYNVEIVVEETIDDNYVPVENSVCNVCGSHTAITNAPNTEVELPNGDVLTCAAVFEAGKAAAIPDEECPSFEDVTFRELCACSERAPGVTTETPPPSQSSRPSVSPRPSPSPTRSPTQSPSIRQTAPPTTVSIAATAEESTGDFTTRG